MSSEDHKQNRKHRIKNRLKHTVRHDIMYRERVVEDKRYKKPKYKEWEYEY